MQSLAIKYRPKIFDDVVEQGSTTQILKQQILNNSIKGAYLFVGSAGTGKTTCARIFAKDINGGKGNPYELDAASNNGVDDIRKIEGLARVRALDAEYKTFIIDECHMLSGSAWAAFLKLLEEPPAKTVFIFCTTDPQKIPNTILSRAQRYTFNRISTEGIVKRLRYICDREVVGEEGLVRLDALEYIAKTADGGLRDALTMLDKVLAYSSEVTTKNVIEALGVSDYERCIDLTYAILDKDDKQVISCIEEVYNSGIDLKNFTKQFMEFILDTLKFQITDNLLYTGLPDTDTIRGYLKETENDGTALRNLLTVLIDLYNRVRYSNTPKPIIESTLLLF